MWGLVMNVLNDQLQMADTGGPSACVLSVALLTMLNSLMYRGVLHRAPHVDGFLGAICATKMDRDFGTVIAETQWK
jgi:hypothetical protein